MFPYPRSEEVRKGRRFSEGIKSLHRALAYGHGALSPVRRREGLAILIEQFLVIPLRPDSGLCVVSSSLCLIGSIARSRRGGLEHPYCWKGVLH